MTIKDHTLNPRGGAFWSGTLQSAQVTSVMISDQQEQCDQYEDADPCSEATQNWTPGEGTFLKITVTGQSTGDYFVEGKDLTRQAKVEFRVQQGGATQFTDRATSGLVTFEKLEPGARVSGRYSVQMASGTPIEGEFRADACTGLDRMVKRVASVQLDCATTFEPTTCSAHCTCLNRTNLADCSRTNSASEWDCTCTQNGNRTKCTVPKTEANVCTQGNGCCDTSF
ncbi:MAG: hypothetical protein HY901_29995 [Deltaproteobacteria bacterium]|nr:hypothetical protein [Deltaproteobacteria bacterium]